MTLKTLQAKAREAYREYLNNLTPEQYMNHHPTVAFLDDIIASTIKEFGEEVVEEFGGMQYSCGCCSDGERLRDEWPEFIRSLTETV